MSALPLRGETTNWQAGDLAMCIRSAPWTNEVDDSVMNGGPQYGHVFRVVIVTTRPHGPGVYLGFDEWPDHYFDSPEFRRIVPDLPTETDRQIAALKRRARQRVPA